MVIERHSLEELTKDNVRVEKYLDNLAVVRAEGYKYFVVNTDTGEVVYQEPDGGCLLMRGNYIRVERRIPNVGYRCALMNSKFEIVTPFCFHRVDDWVFGENDVFRVNNLTQLTDLKCRDILGRKAYHISPVYIDKQNKCLKSYVRWEEGAPEQTVYIDSTTHEILGMGKYGDVPKFKPLEGVRSIDL